MRTTGAGDRLLVWARRLLDQAGQARAEVAGQDRSVRLGALPTIAAALVPRVLDRLAERRPGLRVEVRAGTGRDGLGSAPPPAPLTFLDVEPVPLVLVAAPGHPPAGRPALAPADLAGERLLADVPACSFRMAADRLLGPGPGPERVRAAGVPVMRAWAERGLGVALLPEFAVAPALAAGTLARLPLAAPDLSLRLVWRGDREDVPGLRDVLYAASA
ncbi:hypothetical protein GCM10009678_58850 [Actinomadura kijaniata]|uniref:DNA-binding transcriptional LysR family regulator n=1 Tax=Actinomadura namibiensis TaxID=182080 RepID=A0A7W3QKX0_ACTNM|nr:LysR family transcriptional regulator substrate-binding protein [Actinomadura namibiensis]MBA8950890.1 DNA-binding transcriptional LysR family regulator [Actinomadura namibiensis]